MENIKDSSRRSIRFIFSPEDSKLPFVPIRTNLNEGDCLVVYFDFKSSELSHRTQKQLLILKNFLDVFNNNSLKIYGHADEIGSQDFNMNLSIERATEVKKFLMSNGIENSKSISMGKGNPRSGCLIDYLQEQIIPLVEAITEG